MDNSTGKMSIEGEKYFLELQNKIKTLTLTAWYDRNLNWSEVDSWLSQFNMNEESSVARLQMLFLVSNFLYFGKREIEELLKTIFRDFVKYPIVYKYRKENSDTKNLSEIQKALKKRIGKTFFMGMGNPSESATHLLYHFRKINSISKKKFLLREDIFQTDSHGKYKLKETQIDELIFIDDLSCSGSQAKDYSKNLIDKIKERFSNIKIRYITLFSTDFAQEEIQKETSFDRVECVFNLDSSFKCFSDGSRFYKGENNYFDKQFTKEMCRKYDHKLKPGYELGYKSSQLLLGFFHNTPDNVPPIFWFKGDHLTPWDPIFPRDDKIY